MKKRIQYIITGDATAPVIDIGGGYFVLAGQEFKYDGIVYDVKEEAMYDKLISDLSKGKPVSNFKSSKYYKYYVDRLKKEHPEYII